jgi:ppGpp synthetase/RelA/SpoT-type nucleotidyltranferase
MEKNQMSSRLMNHVRALKEEINVLKERIQPHDTGHIHTTISTLEERVKEINKLLEKNKIDE